MMEYKELEGRPEGSVWVEDGCELIFETVNNDNEIKIKAGTTEVTVTPDEIKTNVKA